MNKNIVITGSTDGIGKGTAIRLAQEGHHIYLHGRNPEKLAAVIPEVMEHSPHPVKGFVADFSNLNAVRHMGKQIVQELPQIDVLINNAGVYNSHAAINVDGWDMRMVVNYMAPYLLTREVLPAIKKGTTSRIINLSSAAQKTIHHGVFIGQVRTSEGDAYAQSKLAVTMWSFYLAQLLSDIPVIAVNPGSLLNTKMVRQAFGKHWNSVDKGVQLLCEIATDDKYNESNGLYYDNDSEGFGQAHPDAYDKQKIDQLINATEELIGHI